MKRTKHRKLPNGFGQISYIPSRQFNQYRVMITVGHDEMGRPICKLLKPVSYFESYNDAFAALIEYNKNPRQRAREMTLKQLFDEWLPLQEFRVSESSIRSYKTSFKRFSDYQDELVINISPRIITLVTMNAYKESFVIGQRVKTLADYLFDYAVVNEIIATNYSKAINLKFKEGEVEHHITFSDSEMQTMWKNTNISIVKWILIQCYTGMRPSELCEIELKNISLEENRIIGGIKTASGKHRKIPIHPCIKNFISEQMEISRISGSKYLLSDPGSSKQIRYQTYKNRFYEMRDNLKLNSAHTLHDCRKFFITTAKKCEMNDFAIKRIVGHDLGDVTEEAYTDREFSWLYQELLKISVGTE